MLLVLPPYHDVYNVWNNFGTDPKLNFPWRYLRKTVTIFLPYSSNNFTEFWGLHIVSMQVCEGIRELLDLPAEKPSPQRIFWYLLTIHRIASVRICYYNCEEEMQLCGKRTRIDYQNCISSFSVNCLSN
jgi:hypothetical protein